MSSSTESPAIAQLRQLLSSTLRISVADGRIFIGSFIGTDQPMNILLIDTQEFRLDNPETGKSNHEDDSVRSGRFVGQVLIPWKIVRKIEVQESSQPGRRMQSDYNGYIL
ncbi:hypothetical protein EV361DRAFT_793575 [Lentinula raphanica]|uniref:Sm domain-containing protein n=1 Tax=Lentinula raphanica TaxID=153919 RepID=A0AA38PBX1_9AGAR|nr:hypothetical protein F5880DRAFT_1470906 [Lentinula raphanica]KAJ3840082.1 hypothetical protein F5878DRAFT_534317 [Lentinula raphanica]KAJ3974780.1 hypothetical protein EV361DRAFT_793575 [Lentinula raphanica]